jgi:hypothetical protein
VKERKRIIITTSETTQNACKKERKEKDIQVERGREGGRQRLAAKEEGKERGK